MSWTGKRVLVTGAGGFIGSHVTERLVSLGAETRALVHYNALGSLGWLGGSAQRNDMEIVAGDICDRDSVTRAMEGVDVVFHLAALIAIPYSYQAPGSYIRTNIEGTINVLTAARQTGALVIQTSTSEVYGSALRVPIDEQHPLQGQSPYSASKIGSDMMAEAFHRSFGVRVATVRPFNTFGPRQSARAVIPTIITQTLFGDEVRLGSLDPTRDFNFVLNTVDGFIKAAETPAAIGRTVNLGSGREISVGALVDLVAELVGRTVKVITEDHRKRPVASEVDRLLCDNRLAVELLGWQPKATLEEGLLQTIAWFREQGPRDRHHIYAI